MDIQELLHHVDHTMLDPLTTWEKVRTACDQAIAHNTATVCIPPRYVKRAAEYVGNRLKLCTVVGFPNGYSTPGSRCSRQRTRSATARTRSTW